MSPRRPNIIVLMGDQHTYAQTGCYGDPIAQTPTLDTLAAEGAISDAAYCASPICAPCRAAMMCSRYVHELGAWDNGAALSCEWPTFAHDFTAAGYRTALCGKMHFIGPDQHHGFGERWTPDIYPATFAWTEDNRDAVTIHDWGQWRGQVEAAGPGHTTDMDYDELVATQAANGLRAALADPDQALLAVISFTGPHSPYNAPQDYWDRYRAADIPLPDLPADWQDREHPYARAVRAMGQFHEPLPDEVIRRARHAQYARTTMLDDHLARLMQVIEESGQAENTYIIYTADHGDQLGEHGQWYKNTAYEWSARVPFIARGPGITTRRLNETISLHDLGPTLIGLAGIEPLPYRRVGRDLAPLLRGERAEETGEAIIENYACGIRYGVRTIVRGPWKLSVCQHSEPELFHLASDPGEWENRADDPACAPIREELLTAVHASWDDLALQDERRWESCDRRLAMLRAYEQGRYPLPAWQGPWQVDGTPQA